MPLTPRPGTWDRLFRRRGPGTLYRRLKSIEYLFGRDRREVIDFLAGAEPAALSRPARAALIARYVGITNRVRGYHTLGDMLAVAREVLARAGRPGLTVVEAGCAKGSSTAKLSLAARAAGARLLVYDSFAGVPANAEQHTSMDGRPVVFRAGAFRGRIAEVRRTLEQLGAAEVCELHRGWFADTLPSLDRPVDVALLDVDLLESTRTCVRAIMPHLRADGVLFSLDGQLRATHELFASESFWRDEVGVTPPRIDGLGHAKLLIVRPSTR